MQMISSNINIKSAKVKEAALTSIKKGQVHTPLNSASTLNGKKPTTRGSFIR